MAKQIAKSAISERKVAALDTALAAKRWRRGGCVCAASAIMAVRNVAKMGAEK